MIARQRPLVAIAALAWAAGCGSAAVIAPEPLTIVDTSPGNGSIVPAGETSIAVLFSADIDYPSLTAALTLEKISEGGTPIEGVMSRLTSYSKDTFTAVYSVDPLPASQAFRLTVKKNSLRAASGAQLRADFVRSFKTAD